MYGLPVCVHHSGPDKETICIGLDKALFFSQKVMIFFLFLQENIYCWYSLEAPSQGTCSEYPQHMFLWRNKKNTDAKLQFCLKKCLFLSYGKDVVSLVSLWKFWIGVVVGVGVGVGRDLQGALTSNWAPMLEQRIDENGIKQCILSFYKKQPFWMCCLWTCHFSLLCKFLLTQTISAFSSPEQKAQDELLWSLPIRHTSICLTVRSHLWRLLLFWNPHAKFIQTSCEALFERES